MKNLNFKKVLLYTFLITSTLLLIDILTGIFYWNRISLFFSPQNFFYIVNPLLFLVFNSLMLYMVVKNSKITISNNSRPYYENKIKELREQSESIVFEYDEQKYNAINYPNMLHKILLDIHQDKEFMKDERSNFEFNNDLLKEKSYYKYLIHIRSIDNFNLQFFYKDVISLIKEIKQSNTLIESDKKFIIEKIYNDYLKYLFAAVKLFNGQTYTLYSKIPLIYKGTSPDEFTIGKVTSYLDLESYNKLKEELTFLNIK